MLEILQHPVYGLLAVALLSVCVGSFLNVVILRLPQMMQREWHQQCRELLAADGALPGSTDPKAEKPSEAADPAESPAEKFNLNFPASHCPKCQSPLKSWHNIPLFSYILLRGRCAFCKVAIPWRYPAIEFITAAASVHLFLHFGFGWQLAAALLLLWSLITLTVIDIDHQLLPDDITLPLVWLGLFINLFGIFTPVDSAVIGALAGYLSFWLIFQVHHFLTGKEGLGYGDFKLLAALGAWLGWEMLPMIVLFASLIGTVLAVIMMMLKNLKRENPISFGPFLALAGWLALLWGDEITTSYLKLLQF